jgi:superoxide dismutase, Cu-Zn family
MKIRILSIALLAACTKSTMQTPPSPSPTSPASSLPTPPSVAAVTAVATIRDGSNKEIGTATFIDTYSGVLVMGSVSGLGLGAHGMHIHAVGKCEPPFTTAGPHFNPANRQHGFRNANGPHLGDMPNADTPAAGAYNFELLLPGVTLKNQNALLDGDGAAIVVHAARDDYTTDPSGNSGGRVACGVIAQR